MYYKSIPIRTADCSSAPVNAFGFSVMAGNVVGGGTGDLPNQAFVARTGAEASLRLRVLVQHTKRKFLMQNVFSSQDAPEIHVASVEDALEVQVFLRPAS
jgi:hypothetical protein